MKDKITRAKGSYSKFVDSGFRMGQMEAIEFCYTSDKKVIVVIAPTGCHVKGQGILMYSGEIKKVEGLKCGEFLMGPDGKPRMVEGLIKGEGVMYQVIPNKGVPFVVNEDHILTLKKTNVGSSNRNGKMDGSFRDVSVKEYLTWSNTQKHLYKLVRSNPVRSFDVNFKQTVDPYFLGLLLGDGSICAGNINLTSVDKEIINDLHSFASSYDLQVRNQGVGYYLSEGNDGHKRTPSGRYYKYENKLLKQLRCLGVYGKTSKDKFIPLAYKTSPLKERLEILAGLIDTDGSLSKNCFDFISKSKQLSEDVAFISRSVGLAAYVKPCVKGCQNNFKGTYYRVSISGNIDTIPCRLPRKQASPRTQKKDVLVTGFTITKSHYGKFYGFTLSGKDGRYLMDDFTITHNSGKSVLGMTLGAMYDKFLYLVSSKQLQDQLFIDFKEAEMMKGRANYPCLAIPSYTAEDCFNTEETPCPQKYKCVYRVQKQKTLNSPKQILNYNYFITEANYVGLFTNYPLIVADEADSLEDILSSTVSLDFSVRMMKNLGIPFPKFKSFTANHAIEEWNAWCDKSTEILKEKYADLGIELEDAVQGSQDHIRLVREQQRVGGLISKVRIFKTYMDDTWIVDIIKKGDEVVSWSMKPTWLNGELTDKYFFRHGAKFVMMSATFPNKEVLAELLGLGLGDIDVIELPSTFPVENRQVMLEYAADMKSMKGGLGIEENEIRKAQKAIVDILAKHPNDKGIIHTVNWKLNKAVMDIGSNRLVTHTSQDKVDVLDRFIQSKEPLVFVSPSSTRGVDLYDDRARFTIIAKAPFKSLGDKLVAARVYSKHGVGQYWYQSICAQEIVQACGRAVRSKDDYAVSYILDKQACDLIVNHRRLFPQYFIEAVELG
jgi:Rad3-related DNA helicase